MAVYGAGSIGNAGQSAPSNMTNAQVPEIDPLEGLLSNAMHEIRHLRHKNEILEAKVSMIDLFVTVLFSQAPHQSVGAQADVSYALERKINELREQQAQAKTP